MKTIEELFPQGIGGQKPDPDELRTEIQERRALLCKIPRSLESILGAAPNSSEYDRLFSEILSLENDLEYQTRWKPFAEFVRKSDAESRRSWANQVKKWNASKRHKALLEAAKKRREENSKLTVNAVAAYLIEKDKTDLKKRRVSEIIKPLWEK